MKISEPVENNSAALFAVQGGQRYDRLDSRQ